LDEEFGQVDRIFDLNLVPDGFCEHK